MKNADAKKTQHKKTKYPRFDFRLGQDAEEIMAMMEELQNRTAARGFSLSRSKIIKAALLHLLQSPEAQGGLVILPELPMRGASSVPSQGISRPAIEKRRRA